MSICYLHLGSNIGEKLPYIIEAFSMIEQSIGPILATSSFYRTEAWGLEDQEDFINIAIQVETYLDPHSLLKTINKIEGSLFRKRVIQWGERTIDIDILFYDNLIIDTDELTVPHAHMNQRNFVLGPMAEMAPEYIHPITKKTMVEQLDLSEDKGKIYKIKTEIEE